MDKEHSLISGQLDKVELQYTPIETISDTVSALRDSFASGTMRDISFRKQQLRALLKGMREDKKNLLDALYHDLHKSHTEGLYAEYDAVEYEIGQYLDNMDKWVKPSRNALASEQPAFLLSKSEVRKEPLGVVVILGA
ncbi:Hexadecenal dehydrogenase, partial [Coemansia sp. S17]